jgi:hypothetical protein
VKGQVRRRRRGGGRCGGSGWWRRRWRRTGGRGGGRPRASLLLWSIGFYLSLSRPLSSSPATIFQESSLSWSTSSFQEWSIERFCRLGLVFVPVQGLVINQSVVAVSVCNQLTLRFSMLLYYSRIETSKLRAIAFVLLVLTL